jgi:hypothetical protein
MKAAFGHISVLVVVLNAIGLGTLMVGMAAFLRKPPKEGMKLSGLLLAWLLLHVYLHVMLWWRFYGVEISESFNFFSYLFMLAGPMVLLFASTMLLPEEQEGLVDMPAHFERIRSRFFVFETLFWIWALLFAPVVGGFWGTTWPFWSAMIGISLLMVFVSSRNLRIILTSGAWLVQVWFMGTLALQLRNIPAS